MKKILSAVCVSAIILSCLSFSSLAAPKKKGYSAGSGASYLMDIGDKLDEKYYEFSDGRKISLDNIDDEDFIVIEKPYVEDGKSGKAKKNSTLSLKIDAANLTYKAINQRYSGVGIPEGISIGDDLENQYIGFRIRIEDNSPAFSSNTATSTMRISLESDKKAVTQLTTSYSHFFYWLDLNDGSMTAGHFQSGYMPINRNKNKNNRTSGIESTGDMDGYLLLPLKCVLSSDGSNSSTLISKKNLRQTFKSIIFEFRSGNTDVDGNPAKNSSWEQKAFLLGDGLLVNSLESFAEEKSNKRNIAGEMYAPIGDDSAYYAMRVAGYRSFDQVRVSDAFGKMPFDPKANVPDMQSNRQFVHIATLPNGDRARELILNSKNNSSVTDSKGNPYTSGDAMLSMYDTYDFSKRDENGCIVKHGVRTKGVPWDIELDGVKYLAFRVATRDGSKKNEAIEFSIRLEPSESASTSLFRTTRYYLTAGGITYLDLNSLKTRTLSVSGGDKDKLISANGNLDGYLIIPIDRFNTKSDGSGSPLDKDVIRTRWGAYYNYAYQGMHYYLKSGFENGKAFYAGDVFFVSDKDQFISVRKTDCASVGHKIEIIPEIPATCKAQGVSEGKRCSVCDLEIRGFETLERTAHSYKLSQKVEPTQNSEGYEIYKCEVCKATIQKDYGEKLEDNSSAVTPEENDASSVPQGSDTPHDTPEQDSQKDENSTGDGDVEQNGLPTVLIIVIVAAVLLIAGAVLTVLLIRKKKK